MVDTKGLAQLAYPVLEISQAWAHVHADAASHLKFVACWSDAGVRRAGTALLVDQRLQAFRYDVVELRGRAG